MKGDVIRERIRQLDPGIDEELVNQFARAMELAGIGEHDGYELFLAVYSAGASMVPHMSGADLDITIPAEVAP